MSQKIPHELFSDIFPERLGIFSPNFTHLLHVPICAGIHIFIQLYATLTKLCHIKHDHHCSKCPPSVETHARWLHLIWHNFVTVGENCVKNSNLHCVSKKPDTCDIFKYLQQIMTNINNFWYKESSINLQSTDVKCLVKFNKTGYQLSLFP